MPWTKNTAVAALHARRIFRGPRDGGSRIVATRPIARRTSIPAARTQVFDSLLVGFAVGDQDVYHSDVADVPEGHPTDLRSISDCNDSTRGAYAAARLTTASARWWTVTPAVTSNPHRLMT